MGRLRNYFITGILVTAPIAITFSLVWVLIDIVDRTVEGMIPPAYNPATYIPVDIPGLGLLMTVVTLIVIGAFAAGVAGKLLVTLGDDLVSRMPVIRSIYGALKQILETVLAQQSTAFRQVVLIEYPRRGVFAIGFVTGTTEGEVQNLTADTLINIFVPTTPNPTSGFLLFLPKKDIVVLDMPVEDGIKMVISGGIVTPPDRRGELHRKYSAGAAQAAPAALVETSTQETIAGQGNEPVSGAESKEIWIKLRPSEAHQAGSGDPAIEADPAKKANETV